MNNWIPDFIIKELERMKREREYEDNRPRVYAPQPPPYMPPPNVSEDDETSGGPVIIDINTYEIIEEDD